MNPFVGFVLAGVGVFAVTIVAGIVKSLRRNNRRAMKQLLLRTEPQIREAAEKTNQPAALATTEVH